MIIYLKWLSWKKQRFLHLWITPFEAAMCLFTWQEKLVVSVSSFTSCSNKMRKITPSLEISFKSFDAIKGVWNASPFLRPGVVIWKPVVSEKLKPYISWNFLFFSVLPLFLEGQLQLDLMIWIIFHLKFLWNATFFNSGLQAQLKTLTPEKERRWKHVLIHKFTCMYLYIHVYQMLTSHKKIFDGKTFRH